MRRLLRGWGWLAPGLAVLLVVTGWPVGRAIWQALSSSTLTNPSDRAFVGADQFVNVVSSREWWLAVAVSLAAVVFIVVLQVGLGFGFASVLSRITSAVPVASRVILVPFALLAVVNAFIWREAISVGFIANWFKLDELGRGGELVAWGVAEVWRGTAIVTLLLWVGLSRVSDSLLDSATADGATPLQRFRRVILPAVAPFMAAAVAYRVLDTFRSMDSALLSDSSASSLTPVPLLVWNTTFSSFEVGLGAATSLVLLAVAGMIGLLLIPLLRVRRVV